MQTFRVTLNLRSAVASAFQADTIFGHLCWALRYLEGEEALREFLGYYREGIPPFLVSDGFPGDLLPGPLLPPEPPQTDISLTKQKEAFDSAKNTRKVGYLTVDEFNRVIKGERVQPYAGKHQPHERNTLKNRIDRLSGTTGDNGELFEFEETYWSWNDGNSTYPIPVSIYLNVEKGFEEQAKRLFQFVAEQGYGKRKSVGYGTIDSMEFESFNGFSLPSDPNGFVSLSGFVPAENDPTHGFWKVRVKYGKLGEEFASGGNPFKKPIVMLTAGSVFLDDSPRAFYGTLVPKVTLINPEIVQYGFALPIPIKIPTNGNS